MTQATIYDHSSGKRDVGNPALSYKSSTMRITIKTSNTKMQLLNDIVSLTGAYTTRIFQATDGFAAIMTEYELDKLMKLTNIEKLRKKGYEVIPQ